MLVAGEQTFYVLSRSKSILGLRDDLCEATLNGKPQCLCRVTDIEPKLVFEADHD